MRVLIFIIFGLVDFSYAGIVSPETLTPEGKATLEKIRLDLSAQNLGAGLSSVSDSEVSVDQAGTEASTAPTSVSPSTAAPVTGSSIQELRNPQQVTQRKIIQPEPAPEAPQKTEAVPTEPATQDKPIAPLMIAGVVMAILLGAVAIAVTRKKN